MGSTHFSGMVYSMGVPVVGGLFGPWHGKGKVIYVDTAANNANDGNVGTEIGEAKLTISGALDACTDDNWDTIVVLDYTASSEIEWPISVDVERVRIMAAPSGGYMPRYEVRVQATGDYAAMTLDANQILIEGLEFRAGASHGGIEFDTADVYGHGIVNCMFTTGAYGIYATANGMPSQGPLVRHCIFINALTSDGILYDSNGPFFMFEDNIFDEVGGIAINIAGWPKGGHITGNVIGLKAATAGKAIAITGGQAERIRVNNNYANFSRADMSNNPYLDSAAQDNHWMLNYRNITALLPSAS